MQSQSAALSRQIEAITRKTGLLRHPSIFTNNAHSYESGMNHSVNLVNYFPLAVEFFFLLFHCYQFMVKIVKIGKKIVSCYHDPYISARALS